MTDPNGTNESNENPEQTPNEPAPAAPAADAPQVPDAPAPAAESAVPVQPPLPPQPAAPVAPPAAAPVPPAAPPAPVQQVVPVQPTGPVAGYPQQAPGHGQPAPAPGYGQTGPVPGYGQPAPGQGYAQSGPVPGYPQYAAAPGYAPVQQRAPMSKGVKRGLLIGGISVGVLALLVGGGLIAINVINGNRGPEQVATQYLEHIAAGRAEAASAMVDPKKNETEAAFLTDEVLASATERISDIKITETNRVEDRAVVQATYQLAGETHNAALLVQKGDPEFFFLDTWEVVESMASEVSIYVQGGGDVNVAGKLVEGAGEGSFGDMSVTLYPAVYQITPVESKYSTFEPTPVVVGQFFSSAMVEYVPTDALFDELQAEVDALVSSCLAATTIDPDGCPFGTYSWGLVGDVSWTLKAAPVVERDYFYGDYFDASGGVASASYREEWFGETTDEVADVSFSISGSVEVVGDQLEVTFNSSWW